MVTARDAVGAAMAGLATVVRVDKAAEAAMDLVEIDVAARRRSLGKVVPLVLVPHLAKTTTPEVRRPRLVEVKEEVDVELGQDTPTARLAGYAIARPVLATRLPAYPSKTKTPGFLAHAKAGVDRPVAAMEMALGRVPCGAAPEVGAIVANPNLALPLQVAITLASRLGPPAGAAGAETEAASETRRGRDLATEIRAVRNALRPPLEVDTVALRGDQVRLATAVAPFGVATRRRPICVA